MHNFYALRWRLTTMSGYSASNYTKRNDSGVELEAEISPGI